MEKNRVFSDGLTQIIPSEEKMPAIEWLAEQMPGGFFIYRAEGDTELLYVNHATCDIFGCSTLEEFREYTGNTFKGMVHPDDYEKIQESIDDQIASSADGHKMDYVVYRIIRKDGSIRWVDDYGHFANLPGYGDVYYVFIGDITENRLASEERKRAEELALALKAAEQANLAKSAFLSNMSHEIRTPITAILGMNEMIQREARRPEIIEYSENIRKAGVSLLGIISDILDFSKIETGRMELECDEYSLSYVAVDLYNLVQFRAEAKGLDLEFKIDESLPVKLYGDEIKVKQVISNLLTNAAKYTESGKVTFEMKEIERMPDTGSVKIEVSVTDTGIGIREEEMKRIFEPFGRLDTKRTRSIEGSGLGLSITRELLTLMGSDLKIESTYGKGSRFYFTFVQKIVDETPVGVLDVGMLVHEKTGSNARKVFFTAPGMRLLVVDDTPMNLQVIAGLLKRTRMHIDVCTSGAECLERFKKEDYDLVFMDYRMPKMDGIETLYAIKRDYPEKYKTIPIISLTASAVSGDKEKMIKAGFTDYLPKPINIDEMEKLMIKYLPADSIVMEGETGSVEEEELKKLPPVIFENDLIDPEKGIEYCGDADDYIYALKTYAESVDEKSERLKKDLQDKDIEAFTFNVHSLKSTSGAIGARGIFEKARALEQAGKNKDTETIERDIKDLLKEYGQMKSVIKRIVDAYAEKTAEGKGSS